MAQINGQGGKLTGFQASVAKIEVYKPPKVPKVGNCHTCGGIIANVSKRSRNYHAPLEDDDGNPMCHHCGIFFGIHGWTGIGVTTCSPREAREKLAAIAEAGWAMVLKSGHFCADNGDQLALELGDCMRVKTMTSGPEKNEMCSQGLTKRLFTVSVILGEHEVIQYPHEVAAINWLTIMELRGLGELEEQYVADNDETGYFGPTPDMREAIRSAFGDR